jgi:hypothetical protein
MKPHTPTLVSVHLPKTAGTSFGKALRERFGDGLQEDYTTLPLHQPRGIREWSAIRAGFASSGPAIGARAIHGHFLPLQYRIAMRGRDVRYVTWLRDPVERVLSHYYFWQRTAHAATRAQPLRHRMLQDGWSLERFCLGPELKNLYRQWFWGFDVRRFAFIGITECYQADLEQFAVRFLAGQSVLACERRNPELGTAGRYEIDPGLRARIERHHAADVALYHWARRRRGQATVLPPRLSAL